MYADHALRLAQKVITENFFLCLLRQEGKGSVRFRMVQNGGLAAGGKKIFFKLLRLGSLCYFFYKSIFSILRIPMCVNNIPTQIPYFLTGKGKGAGKRAGIRSEECPYRSEKLSWRTKDPGGKEMFYR